MDEPARAGISSLTGETQRHARLWWTLAAFLFAGACLFVRLGGWALINPDEGRNASIALEMKTNGTWLVPTYDGLPYLDKPAFYFRAVALSFSLFGKSEAAARLPSVVFGLALLVVVYLFCRREFDWRTGVLAVVLLGATPMYVSFSRMVIFDMALTCAVCSSVFAGFLAEKSSGREQRAWYAASAFAAAIATLIKGPVGFFVPLLVLLVFGLVERHRGALRRFCSPVNLLIFFGIVLAWFVGVTLRRHDFPYYGLMVESFQRFSTTKFHRHGPIYYYVIVIAVFFFPWSMLLPGAVVSAWRTRSRRLPVERMLAVMATVVVVFFSLSKSKLPEYVLPALVALAILLARLFSLARARPEGRASRLVRRSALLMSAVSAVVAVLLWLDVYRGPYLIRGLRVHGTEGQLLQGLFGATCWAFAIGAILGFVAYALRSPKLVFAVFSVFMSLWLTLAWGDVQTYAETLSSRALAVKVAVSAGPADIVLLQCFPTGLPYYLGRTVSLVSVDGHETTSNYVVFSLERNRSWPPNVIPPSDLPEWLARETGPAYLIARDDQKTQLESLASGAGAEVQQIMPGWWGALLLPARTH